MAAIAREVRLAGELHSCEIDAEIPREQAPNCDCVRMERAPCKPASNGGFLESKRALFSGRLRNPKSRSGNSEGVLFSRKRSDGDPPSRSSFRGMQA